MPPSTAPRPPVSVTATRFTSLTFVGKGFITQCTFYMPARAASLPEKQIVTNPATLLSVNDPELKDHQKCCSHFKGFPNYWAGRHRTRGISLAESSQTAHTAKRPTATEVKSFSCRPSAPCNVQSKHAIGVFFKSKSVYFICVSLSRITFPSHGSCAVKWESGHAGKICFSLLP